MALRKGSLLVEDFGERRGARDFPGPVVKRSTRVTQRLRASPSIVSILLHNFCSRASGSRTIRSSTAKRSGIRRRSHRYRYSLRPIKSDRLLGNTVRLLRNRLRQQSSRRPARSGVDSFTAVNTSSSVAASRTVSARSGLSEPFTAQWQGTRVPARAPVPDRRDSARRRSRGAEVFA